MSWRPTAGSGGGGLPSDPLSIAHGGSGASTAAGALTAFGGAADIKVKHTSAVIIGNLGGCSHQQTDPGAATIGGLGSLDNAANLATAGARFSALRTLAIAHFASVGSASADGAHATADGVNGAGIGTNVSTLGSLITRIGEMKTALIAHASQGGVHFGNDPTLAALTLTTDPPTTQGECNADLNDLASALMVHFEASVEQVYA